jgi:BlaI family penicillinase repressor
MGKSKNISLSDGEWKLMHVLWEKAPRTIADIVKALEAETGWTKNTIFVMLGRMEEKGAVYYTRGARARQYYPAIEKDEAAAKETESFLKKVYDGSVGLLVASLAGQKALSKEDIDMLYGILRQAEEEADR